MAAQQVVVQMKELCKEETNRRTILSDHACFSALLLFLDNNDPFVTQTALEAMEYLSQTKENQPEMGKNGTLSFSLHNIINQSNPSLKPIAQRILLNITSVKKPLSQIPSNAFSLKSQQTNTMTSELSKSIVLQLTGSAGKTGKTGKMGKSGKEGKERSRELVEEALLSVRGVISFTFDQKKERFVVRVNKELPVVTLFDAILDVEEENDDVINICQVIKGSDGKESYIYPERDSDVSSDEDDENIPPAANRNPPSKKGKQEEEEDEPGYLDDDSEEEGNKSSALTSQGYEYDDEKGNNKGWLGGFGSFIAKSIWGY